MTDESPSSSFPRLFRRLSWQRCAAGPALFVWLGLACASCDVTPQAAVDAASAAGLLEPPAFVIAADGKSARAGSAGFWSGEFLSVARESPGESGAAAGDSAGRPWTIVEASAASRTDAYRPLAPDDGIPRFDALSAAPIWLRFRLQNDDSRARRVLLELRNASLIEVDLYVPAATDSGFERMVSGAARAFSERRIPYRTPVFAFAVPPGVHTCYLRIAGYSYKKLPLRIFTSESDFAESAAAYTILHGSFYGMLGIMAVFNALLFFTIRDQSYVFMTLFIVFWGLTMFIADGYGQQFFWPGAARSGSFFNVFNPLATISLLLFLRGFLRTRRHAPRIDRFVLPALIAAYALVVISYPVQSDYLRVVLGLQLVLPSGFFVAMLAFALGIIAWRRGNPAGRYHTLAGCVFMIIGELQYLEVFDLVASNIVTENGARVGFVVYITMLTIGTGQRIRKLKESLQKLNARLQLEELRGENLEVATPGENANESPELAPRAAAEWTITPRTEALLQKTIARIQEDFRSEISRESLALELDWNPDNLGRFYKMYTGERIGDAINRLRVEQAAALLRDTEDRVTEIAFAVGFDSLKTFNRNFARLLHTTPSEFRKISRLAPGAHPQ